MIKLYLWHVRSMKTQISLRIRAVWSVFVVHMKKHSILGYPKCAEGRFRSDCANAQADLNLRWEHMSEGTFTDIVAQIWTSCFTMQILKGRTMFFEWCRQNNYCFKKENSITYNNPFLPGSNLLFYDFKRLVCDIWHICSQTLWYRTHFFTMWSILFLIIMHLN